MYFELFQCLKGRQQSPHRTPPSIRLDSETKPITDQEEAGRTPSAITLNNRERSHAASTRRSNIDIAQILRSFHFSLGGYRYSDVHCTTNAMATPSAASPAGARPYNAILITAFALISAAGAWFMRISAVINGVPTGFEDVIAAGAHPNSVPIKKDFTGLTYLDEGLSFLVTAFLAGAAGWNEVAYWQQFHFLLQFITFVVIMTVEACRERNQGSWLR